MVARTKSLHYICTEKNIEGNTPIANNDYLWQKEIWKNFSLFYIFQMFYNECMYFNDGSMILLCF